MREKAVSIPSVGQVLSEARDEVMERLTVIDLP
jgi:hypothetical protein